MQAFGRIQTLSGGKDKIELWVGETGKPTLQGTLVFL